jgi:signal transduction histidine kinase
MPVTANKMKTQAYILKAIVTGAFLGLGAPLGYLLCSYFLLPHEQMGLIAWSFNVIDRQTGLMVYLSVPTITVFSLFGAYHGIQETKLAFKNDQMQHFLNVAAHDIRSPLTVVKEGVSQIKDGVLGPINQDQKEFSQMVSDQAEVMQELLTELLDLNKMEVGKYQLDRKPVEVVRLLRKAVHEMTALFSKKQGLLALSYEVPDDMLVVLDQFRMRQVIRNIIGNAIRYSPKDSVIRIHCSKTSKNEIEITVTNHGSHIPEEKLNLIFDKFAQARDRDQKLGVGLGLSICKNIVELHNGKIWAVNIDPSGVRFHIRLPK